jgi:hypothetical protein
LGRRVSRYSSCHFSFPENNQTPCILNHFLIAYRMDYGEWTENSRGTYNKWDGVSRCTTQVTDYFSGCEGLQCFRILCLINIFSRADVSNYVIFSLNED